MTFNSLGMIHTARMPYVRNEILLNKAYFKIVFKTAFGYIQQQKEKERDKILSTF